MTEWTPILLEIWRAVSHDGDLSRSLAHIAALVAPHLPAEALVLKRIDPASRSLDLAAAARCRPGSGPQPARVMLDPHHWSALHGWAARGQIIARTDRADPVVRERLMADAHPDLLAGPLMMGGELLGVAELIGATPGVFTDEHREMLRQLLDPLAAAINGERRVSQIHALRQAAEADKQSLLRRLGRETMADTIVGVESGLRPVMDRVDIVAGSDLPVLLLGETGSGKEVIARAIHDRSPRRDRPFHRVNCGAIPPELIDSELFGHEKGSFTGAAAQRQGWFERADGGTLLLDEVGELPPAAQVRLLRVLQDHTFERVGGREPITVDIRIIAATHRDLRAMSAEGRFREDLWYRLAVFPVELPPLRQRPQDIAPLARHFALKAARRFGMHPLEPGEADIELLRSYDWPGNVRELQSVLERAVILGQGDRLHVAAALGMPTGTRRNDPSPPPPPTTTMSPTAGAPVSHPLELDAVIRQHIERVLTQTRGKIEGPGGAAQLLGINAHTLRARMRKLDIDWSRFRVN